MTRHILITAAVVAALGSPLVAADQSIEKATRFRATSEATVVPAPDVPQVASTDVPENATMELESSFQIEELGGSCCFIWNVNADQVEELGPYFWNQNADQVDELGGSCCYYWNQNTAEIED